ncbi:D-serine ammonia-lyase [Coprothermobacteraceae bacterium]|nr:D-serine ammonia-lyase [Coprothermobacteraceae bacterium]
MVDDLLERVRRYEPVFWKNPYKMPAAEALNQAPLSLKDVEDAFHRMQRFAPFVKKAFPDAKYGIIESPLVPLPNSSELTRLVPSPFSGPLMLKEDNYLPVCGSVKARGGIYEVLWYAEQVATTEGLMKSLFETEKLYSEEARAVFAKYRLVVGSTGNLGMSIGIMGRAFGFRVQVHMSRDAKEWKKKMLRELGVEVIEHEGDYTSAVAKARAEAEGDPRAHFVDDERSMYLFLGYAVAALGLEAQLRRATDETGYGLKVYIPCGVGTAPGGIAFGLKALFGDRVEVYLAEPTHAPCMLLGLYTGKLDQTSIYEYGLDGVTAADGLAVSKPSTLVSPLARVLIDGVFTVPDQFMIDMVKWLWTTNQIKTEPSANAGFYGLHDRAIHLVWLTGGGMMPDEVFQSYLEMAKQ